jgi:predicted metal-dependent phosphoesterase TrpH
MYKIDTHVHTSETSSCGQTEAREDVRLYKEAGYDAIVITDHYYEGFFRRLKDASWEDKIDCYLQGYQNALEEGNKLGLTVLLGIEIRFTENANDYLVYGITEKFLKENPELYNLGLKKFKQFIAKENMLIFQAHPYRNGMVTADPSDIHGVEIYNGNARHDSRNDKALLFAENNGLLMSSGSDFHQLEDLARGGIAFDQKITTSEELVKAFKNREVKEFIKTE